MHGLENEMERRTVTYTTWNLSAKKAEAKSWHPLTFTSDNSGPEEIEGIKVRFLCLYIAVQSGLRFVFFLVTMFVLNPIFITPDKLINLLVLLFSFFLHSG